MNVNAFIGFLFLIGVLLGVVSGFTLSVTIGLAYAGLACMGLALLIASHYDDKGKKK